MSGLKSFLITRKDGAVSRLSGTSKPKVPAGASIKTFASSAERQKYEINQRNKKK